jgi:CRISPR-associated protein Csb1
METEMSNSSPINPEWLTNRNYAAVVLREYLRPVGGYDTPIFPPTFAMRKKLQRHPYNIDTLRDGSNICLIDSVPSQANRLEPIFDEFDKPRLVRKVTVKVTSGKANTVESISLLSVGHRVADAVVRFSDKAQEIAQALSEYEAGNSISLAKNYATSIVFGAWNSRDAGEKIKRVVQSTIRATNVEPLTRASQYVPPCDYKALLDNQDKPVIDTKTFKDKNLSNLGLLAVPVVSMKTKQKDPELAFRVHGGVLVHGDIRRDASINLVNIRSLRTGGTINPSPEVLRNYIFGLSLMAILYPQDFALRQDCQLVVDQERAEERFNADKAKFGKCSLAMVKRDGTEEKLALDYGQATSFAQDAARAMKLDPDELVISFVASKLRDQLKSKASQQATVSETTDDNEPAE